jgi:hypothetical protein
LEVASYDLNEDVEIDFINPLTLLARIDGNTMYLDKALKAPNRAQFIKAMEEEVRMHTD